MKLFIADEQFRKIEYAAFAKRLTDTFEIAGINRKMLESTLDIWTWTYMPVEIEPSSFVQLLLELFNI